MSYQYSKYCTSTTRHHRRN